MIFATARCFPARHRIIIPVETNAWPRGQRGRSGHRPASLSECAGSQEPPCFECSPMVDWSHRIISRHEPDVASASKRPEPKRRRRGAWRTSPHQSPANSGRSRTQRRSRSGTPLCQRTPNYTGRHSDRGELREIFQGYFRDTSGS